MNGLCVASHWSRTVQPTGLCTLQAAWHFCINRVPWLSGRIHECVVQMNTSAMVLNITNTALLIDLSRPQWMNVAKRIVIDGNGVTFMVGSKGSFLATSVVNTAPAKVSLALTLQNLTVYYVKSQSFSDHPLIEATMIEELTLRSVSIIKQVEDADVSFNSGAVQATNVTSVHVIDCTFLDNEAMNGGALKLHYVGTITIRNSAFIGNRADLIGGAIVIDNARTVLMDSCHFKQNIAGNFGGAISINAVAQSLAITSSSFDGNKSKYGSAIIMSTRSTSIPSIIAENNFTANYAIYQGACYLIGHWHLNSNSLSTNHFDPSNACNGGLQFSCGFASEANVLVVSPPHLRVDDYVDGTFPLHAVAYLEDQLGQRGLTSRDTPSAVVEVGIASPSDVSCGINNDFAQILGSSSDQLVGGVANMSSFTISCIPGGYINTTFRTTIKTWTSSFPDYIDQRINAIQQEDIIIKVPTSMRACRRGEIFDINSATHRSCVECEHGSVSLADNFNNEVTECQVCPLAAALCVGDAIELNGGTWRWAATAMTVLTCPFPNACQGGNTTGDASCALGYVGPQCGLCQAGYFLSLFGDGCSDCQGAIISTSVIVSIIFVLLVLSGYMIFRRTRFLLGQVPTLSPHERRDSLFTLKFKEDGEMAEALFQRNDNKLQLIQIIVSTYQTVANSPIKFNLHLTPVLGRFYSVLQSVNFDVIGLLPVSCFIKFNYQDAMVAATLVPILLMLCLLLLYLVQYATQRYSICLSLNCVINSYPLRVYRNAYITIYLVVSYYTLPMICTRVIGAMVCVDVDPNNESSASFRRAFGSAMRLQLDYSIDCTSSRFYSLYSWASLMAVVYFVVVPGSYFYLLYTYRDFIRNRRAGISKEMLKKYGKVGALEAKNMLRAIGFIFLPFAPQYWYFEIVDLSRRLFFASILAFAVTDRSSQLVVGIIVSLLIYMIYFHMAPYDSIGENELANTGNLQLTITTILLFACQQKVFGFNERAYTAIDIVLLVVNLVIIVQGLTVVYSEYSEASKKLSQAMVVPGESLMHTRQTQTQRPNRLIFRQLARFSAVDIEKFTAFLLDNCDSASVHAYSRLVGLRLLSLQDLHPQRLVIAIINQTEVLREAQPLAIINRPTTSEIRVCTTLDMYHSVDLHVISNVIRTSMPMYYAYNRFTIDDMRPLLSNEHHLSRDVNSMTCIDFELSTSSSDVLMLQMATTFQSNIMWSGSEFDHDSNNDLSAV